MVAESDLEIKALLLNVPSGRQSNSVTCRILVELPLRTVSMMEELL